MRLKRLSVPDTGSGGYIISGKGSGGYLDDAISLILNIIAMIVGLFGVIGGLLSALLGIFTAVDSYFDMLQFVGCPGFDLAFAAVNFFNIFSVLVGLAGIGVGLYFGPMAGAIFFIIGVTLFLASFALGAITTMFFENTCKK